VIDGLLGWASFTIDDRIRLEGVAVRRTVDRRLVLSFPSRLDRQGKKHFLVRPLDDPTRREIEHQVFAQLGLEVSDE